MSEIAVQAVRDVALREIANLPLTQAEWECLAMLAVGIRSTSGLIETLRVVLRQACRTGEGQ